MTSTIRWIVEGEGSLSGAELQHTDSLLPSHSVRPLVDFLFPTAHTLPSGIIQPCHLSPSPSLSLTFTFTFPCQVPFTLIHTLILSFAHTHTPPPQRLALRLKPPTPRASFFIVQAGTCKSQPNPFLPPFFSTVSLSFFVCVYSVRLCIQAQGYKKITDRPRESEGFTQT